MMMWEEQWKLFAPHFKNGKAHVDLAPFGCFKTLPLYPGPGFGDFSHPTTRLVLELMSTQVKGHAVIDIGCGSGILSLAAAAMNAKQVYGYDIDPAAVQHAQKNNKLNRLQEKVTFSTTPPTYIPSQTLLLMNMIRSEQAQAWHTIASQIQPPVVLITSGVLKNDERAYLAGASELGWILQRSLIQEGWMGFVFQIEPT